ncbi:MAG: PilN domain-containing protein [Xanthomonadaceae bacterium]|nr:PilN domain-containing protein [Xanthomonadaceae bacterium]
MSQQINLYQPIFRAQRKVFSAQTIVQIAAVFIVGLLMIYGYASWQVGSLGDRVAELEAQRNTAMSQLQRLSTGTHPATRSRLLSEQLSEAQAEAASRQRLLRTFEARSFGNTQGFSAHYAGLARQRIDGLWLTRVEIRMDGITFDGETEVAELLPRYINRLAGETAFTGTDFTRLRMARGDSAGAPVQFTVTTVAAEAPE